PWRECGGCSKVAVGTLRQFTGTQRSHEAGGAGLVVLHGGRLSPCSRSTGPSHSAAPARPAAGRAAELGGYRASPIQRCPASAQLSLRARPSSARTHYGSGRLLVACVAI